MGNRKYFLLYPFSILYNLITSFRNLLYDYGLLASKDFEIPVICVGNITVGGTGKTPHTEYLINLLKKEFRIAVLSRGYLRKSRGFRKTSSSDGVRDIGDEPLQIFRKFPDIIVAVDRDRAKGINKILNEYPETEVIILDDGFQHRRIKPGLSILLTDFNRLFIRDHLMPYGRLRESPKNSYRACVIVVTKTPVGIPDESLKEISDSLKILPGQKLFFSTITYSNPVPLSGNKLTGNLIMQEDRRNIRGTVVITGIAAPDPLLRYLEKYFIEIKHLAFPDHHFFNYDDFNRITDIWNNLKSKEKYIITTEKDAVRMYEAGVFTPSFKEAAYYIPIEVNFLNNSKLMFDNIILDYVRKNKRDN